MSPSKRAGDTVEPDVDPQIDGAVDNAPSEYAPGSNGGTNARSNGSGGPATVRSDAERGRSATAARPKRRSTTAAAAATVPPERGSTSQRGASSSSITRRSATGTSSAGRDGDATRDPLPTPLPAPATPVVDDPTATTSTAAETAPPSPTARAPVEPTVVDPPVVDSPIAVPPTVPTARVEASTRRPAVVVAPVLPVVVPVGAPAQRGSQAGAPATVDEPVVPPEPPYVTTTMSSHQVAPVPRLVGRRPRVRKVTRVVRHVDPWSVFKVALIFNLVLFGVLLTAGVLLWNVAYATGTIDNLERFFESFGWTEFEFDGGAIFHSGWVAGLFGVVGLTGAAVLGATLFNLITDLVGGIRMTVLEEEVVERTSSPMRRFVVRRPNSAGEDPGSDMRTEGSSLPARRDPVDDPFL